MSQVITKTTDYGHEWNARRFAGQDVPPITHMAFSASDRAPTGGEVALEGELHRMALSEHFVDTAAQQPFAAFVAPTGGYGDVLPLHSVGLFTAEGMVAISRRGGVANIDPDDAIEYQLDVFFDHLDALVVQVVPANGVPRTRRVDTTGGLGGGGDMSVDRTHRLDYANLAPAPSTALGTVLAGLTGGAHTAHSVEQLRNVLAGAGGLVQRIEGSATAPTLSTLPLGISTPLLPIGANLDALDRSGEWTVTNPVSSASGWPAGNFGHARVRSSRSGPNHLRWQAVESFGSPARMLIRGGFPSASNGGEWTEIATSHDIRTDEQIAAVVGQSVTGGDGVTATPGAGGSRVAVDDTVARITGGLPSAPQFTRMPFASTPSYHYAALGTPFTDIVLPGLHQVVEAAGGPASVGGTGWVRVDAYNGLNADLTYMPLDRPETYRRRLDKGVWGAWRREFGALSGDLTLFVRADGKDSNAGTANTPSGAFGSLAHAIRVAMSFEAAGHTITVRVGPGTWGPILLYDGQYGNRIVVRGEGVATTITGQGGPFAVYAGSGITMEVHDVRLVNATVALLRAQGGRIGYGGAIFETGGGLVSHVTAVLMGNVETLAFSTVRGSGAGHHLLVDSLSQAEVRHPLSLENTPHFSGAFVRAGAVSSVTMGGFSAVGTATGARYSVVQNSTLNTASNDPDFLPGDRAGVTGSGGVYN